MRNDQHDQFEDLKQFIDSRISQSESRTGQRLDAIERKVDTLQVDVRNGFLAVGDAISEINDRLDVLEAQKA